MKLISVTRNLILSETDGTGIESLKNRLKDEALRDGIIPGTHRWDNIINDINKHVHACGEMSFDGTALELVLLVRDKCTRFHSTEGNTTNPVSNSELRRWFDRNSVMILGRKGIKANEIVGIFFGLILHPKGKRITLL